MMRIVMAMIVAAIVLMTISMNRPAMMMAEMITAVMSP